MPANTANSRLRIERVEIKDLRALRSLRLPEDGLGWGEKIPDLVLVGGANGTGKTTLLRLISEAVGGWSSEEGSKWPKQAHASVVFSAGVTVRENDDPETQILAGLFEGQFRWVLYPHGTITYPSDSPVRWGGVFRNISSAGSWFAEEQESRVVFLPSERDLRIAPRSTRESARLARMLAEEGTQESNRELLLQRGTGHFAEKALLRARWRDLNALANGSSNPGYFKGYADEFTLFSGGKRQLIWTDDGELLVQTSEGKRHPVSMLSSGEKQILIFITELKHLWRPGSLVLIDEPELHLHEQWQSYLFERLRTLLQERGGQLWLATQSDHLFRIAEPGTKLILR